MCGICGFVGKGTLEDLTLMLDQMIYRGPDARGIWKDLDKKVLLGHQRLSIVDLNDGSQPMLTEKQDLIIVFNGEIYNHHELRLELIEKGYPFKTDHSDTEVLLHGYHHWGKEIVHKLNGMWAFAIYDKTRQILFCSRDRFGKKPFFYTLQDKTFIFSSELRSLIRHSTIKTEISQKALMKYFAYGYIPAPNSLYKNIFKLPAGYNLIFDIHCQSYRIEKYWDFELEPFEQIPKNPEEEWGENIRFLLDKSIKRRLIADVPIGILLSGGIDSSAVCAYASRFIQDQKVKTFSIGFEEKSFDESPYADFVHNFFGTEHYSETFSMDKAASLAPEIIQKLDEPMGDASLIPSYLLCQIARKKVTVALTGDGGDELFAGYAPFKALKMAQWYSRLIPGPVHLALKYMFDQLPTSHTYMSLDFKIKRTLKGLSYLPILWNPVWHGTLALKEIEDLFQTSIAEEDLYSEAIEYWENCRQDSIFDKTLQFYTKLYLQDDILVKSDRASMMHSLELRSPFLDIDLVNFIRKIPFFYKFKKNQTKYILKKALKTVLPQNILSRKKKGFGIPIGKWFIDGYFPIHCDNKFHLNKDFIKRYYDLHRKGKEDHRDFLWNYYVLYNYQTCS